MKLASRIIIAPALALATGAALAHAAGVDFLVGGATSTNNQELAAPVADPMDRVTFEIGW